MAGRPDLTRLAGFGETVAIDLRDGDDADRVDHEGAIEAGDLLEVHRRVVDRQAPGWQGVFEQLLADSVERRSGRPGHAAPGDESDLIAGFLRVRLDRGFAVKVRMRKPVV